MPEFRINEERELVGVAEVLLKTFPPQSLFFVEGEMGAGKTTFISVMCRVLGATGVSSPTFSLVNEYRTPGGLIIHHADLYRVKSLEEALQFGIEEYIGNGDYFFVEWPDLLRPLIKPSAVIKIQDINNHRLISF